jgi:ABC-type Zn uptake system ZnuABC Zn-binding protein ZnuA
MRILLLISLFFAGVLPARGALRVVTTTEDLAAIAQEIGGSHVKVESIAKGYQDPHFVDAKPSYLLKLKHADLFIQVGLELEGAWAPNLLRSARNKKIQPGESGHLDASMNCEILDRGAIADRSLGDVHPEGNPHYWLDPANGRIIAENIKERLKILDGKNADGYEINYESFSKRLAEREAKWEKMTARLKGLKAVTYHNSWPNFVKRFGIQIVDFVEPKPGIPASPAHIEQLTQRIRRENIKLIFMVPYFDDKLPKKIAAETGARVLLLPPSVGGVKGVDDYFELFEYNLSALIDALGDSK